MKNEQIIELARKRMSLAIDGDLENRADALDDMRFASGVDQWPEDIRLQRESEGRPTPTINRMPRFIRQVTGDIRKLNPAIKAIPVDDDASSEGAEIISGLVRRIEYDSKAANVYEGAAENAAQSGAGYFRVLTEYESDDSFNQEIRIKRIHNPLSVYVDPDAKEPTREDAQFFFITDQMTNDEFKEAYPKANFSALDIDGQTDGIENWREQGNVVIAEYIWKEPVNKVLGLLPDGTIIEDPKAIHAVVKKRTVKTHKVMWAKITGTEVLEGPTEMPCKAMPIIAVVGEEMHIGERVVRTSVIRHAKDAQRLYNYLSATQVETLAMQPKAPWLVTAKQIAGLEKFWDQANQRNLPYLPYTPDANAPAPMRIAPGVTSSGVSEEMGRVEDDMKATTGIYDAALGGRSNEQSGVAIRQRQLESDISTSIYTDNLSKAIEQCGRVIVEMIPRVYDTQRNLRIMGDDEEEKVITANSMEFHNGQIVPRNPITQGKYSVRVTVGPNYTTRRQETAESMIQFVQAFPQAGQVAGDLIAKAMDWPDADKLAARLKKTLPPGMIDPADMPDDERAQYEQQQQAEQQANQAQEQLAQQMQEIMMRKEAADATESEADAQKALADADKTKAEAADVQFELAMKSGQAEQLISQIVQQQIAQILQGMNQG